MPAECARPTEEASCGAGVITVLSAVREGEGVGGQLGLAFSLFV